MMLALATILLSTVAPADMAGKWEGQLTATRSDGATHQDTVLLILTQKGGTITGTIGGSEADQHAISTGTIDGDKRADTLLCLSRAIGLHLFIRQCIELSYERLDIRRKRAPTFDSGPDGQRRRGDGGRR